MSTCRFTLLSINQAESAFSMAITEFGIDFAFRTLFTFSDIPTTVADVNFIYIDITTPPPLSSLQFSTPTDFIVPSYSSSAIRVSVMYGAYAVIVLMTAYIVVYPFSVEHIQILDERRRNVVAQ
ncbi:13.8 kDa [Spodoptera frugiperda ascovirus 1a]|uniref:13.8 kDa n=1 Tax=Spodoptera frugiperda ascovirus 1a TaxID=113370 RepID=Q0E591_SFAVA|nr:13.8 kDa [Spodoptera frugiperda ascovirus 1a]CAL44610.1 13.8 kDa [Spodoptera frugiperda ascovirus 1a]